MTPARKIVPTPLPGAKVLDFTKYLKSRRDYELAFLPAALEIAETPASPVGVAIGATIILVFCAAFLWACIGTVDIVAVAPGRIVPVGRTQVIQPFEIGVVRSINVHDGQEVRAGDVLIEVDPTIAAAEAKRSNDELVGARLDMARLTAALSDSPEPMERFVAPAGADETLVATYRQYLANSVSELNAKLAEVDRQRAQKQAEGAVVAATIGKLQATLPVLQERVDVRKGLYSKELGSKLTYLTEYQDLVEMQQDLVVQKSRAHETESAIATLDETRLKILAEHRQSLFEELTKAQQKAAQLQQELLKAQRRTQLQELTSPIDGVVQQLAVHTIGGVVTPAQVLAVVVPSGSNLEIEARVSNHDIGFVHVGQKAQIKVDTFSFTRYGLLQGTLVDISHDAVSSDRPSTKAENKSADASASGDGNNTQDFAYVARVSLEQTNMPVDKGLASLSPGMAVSVEIKTGSRRIIDYLISPLVKYKHDMLRER